MPPPKQRLSRKEMLQPPEPLRQREIGAAGVDHAPFLGNKSLAVEDGASMKGLVVDQALVGDQESAEPYLSLLLVVFDPSNPLVTSSVA